MAEEEVKTDSAGGKNYKPILIAGAVVIVGLATTVAVMAFRGSGNKEAAPAAGEQKESRSVLVTEDNVDEVLDTLAERNEDEPKGDAAHYIVTMNSDWMFPNGSKSSSSNSYVENDKENTTDVYFDLVMEDNEDEVLYSSPIIPVGAKMEEFSLDKELESGQYSCVCIYHLVDDEQNTLSTVRVKVNVFVN